jgi:HEPN domain-containing protein
MNKQRRIETQLFLAQQDVEAALLLAANNNRYAAFHCQQASEKLIKALLDAEGSSSGRSITSTCSSTGYRTPSLGRLSCGDWRSTAPMPPRFRYAKPAGGLMPAPDPATVIKDAREIGLLIDKARTELVGATKSRGGS